jgi:uncharacterized Zn-binding protein involved in type VI secretion
VLEATRVTDGTIGVCNIGLPCCPHSRAGTNATGSPDVRIDGLPAHRVTDTGPCNCPHGGTFESVEGSATVRANGLRLTRIADITVCQNCGQPGNHAAGSPDVRIGD